MKIVCLIDCQNDFIKGPLGTPEADKAMDNLQKWLEKNLKPDDYVIFTKDTHINENKYLQTREGKNLPIPHCLKETTGWIIDERILKAVQYETNNWQIFEKDTFGYDMLPPKISDIISVKSLSNPIVYFAGLCSDICLVTNVLYTQTDFHNEYDIRVLKDCCAGTTPEAHEAAFAVMKSCQITIE